MSRANYEPPPYDDGDFGRGPEVRLALPPITPVVKRLMIINALVFLATFVAWLAFDDPARQLTTKSLGLNPDLWKSFFPFLPVWQLFSYGFLHDLGDLLHLGFNMLLLFFFGTMLEGILGSRRFLVTYLMAMLAGAVLHLVAEFASGGMHRAIGASGAVLGILIATAALRPNTQVLFFFIPVKLKWLAVGIVTLDVFALLVSWKTGRSDNVAHYVHLGGAAYGLAAVRLGWLTWDPIQRVRERRDTAIQTRTRDDELRMDTLLEKIHRSGLQSLTRGEKDFLKRMSDRR